MSFTIAQLRAKTDEELIAIHDQLAENTGVGTRYYQEELLRRDQERQTLQMLQYTKSVTLMTWVMTIATILNLLLAAIAVCLTYKGLSK